MATLLYGVVVVCINALFDEIFCNMNCPVLHIHVLDFILILYDCDTWKHTQYVHT